MTPQPKTIDQVSEIIAAQHARPELTIAALTAALHKSETEFLQLEKDLDPADIEKLITCIARREDCHNARESYQSIRLESRQKTLADAAAVNLHDIGKGLLEHGLAERTKGRAAKHAGIGKEAAAHQTALMNPDLSPDEWDALENLRAGLVGQAEALEYCFSVCKSAIERFSNVPSAETWHDAVRAVRAVNFA